MARKTRFNLKDYPIPDAEAIIGSPGLHDEEDYRFFLECLGKPAPSIGAIFIHYALLRNEFHLITTPRMFKRYSPDDAIPRPALCSVH